jgi:hypothetical protein
MSSSLNITKKLNADNKWEIVAFVQAGGTLPLDIFMYENTGDTTLGNYIGVCNLEEYQRLATFNNVAIPKFGNRYVKSTQAKIKADIEDDTDLIINRLTSAVKSLSLAITNSIATTQIISIP